jgi:hypothetical protein
MLNMIKLLIKKNLKQIIMLNLIKLLIKKKFEISYNIK